MSVRNKSANLVTVIVRRLPVAKRAQVEAANRELREAVKGYKGFLNGHDMTLPVSDDTCDLVTVYSFATRDALKRWEAAPERARLLENLDRHCLRVSDRASFDGLTLLQPDSTRVSKHEIVVILIALILLLGGIADALVPPLTEPWRGFAIIAVNVCLISYVLLPGSIRLWVKLRGFVFGR